MFRHEEERGGSKSSQKEEENRPRNSNNFKSSKRGVVAAMWCLKKVFNNSSSKDGDGGGVYGRAPTSAPSSSSPGKGKNGSRNGSVAAGGAVSSAENSRVLDQEELEEQSRVNKMIEKQIRKDKRRFRSTHRLQVVGLEGSGKSTLIHQLRLLHHNGYFTEERRRERLAGIKHIVRESTQALAIGLRDNGVAQSEEAVAAREWVCAHASRNCPEPCQAFYEHAKRLWADDETKAFYRRHRHNQELASAGYFLDRLSLVSNHEYLPTAEDLLRHYVPTTSLQETSIEIEHVTFSLFEVNAATNTRWLREASDAIAVIFVADISSFDALIDPKQGITRLHETMFFFRSVWNSDHCINGTGGSSSRPGTCRSVILFLNKVDQLEEKVKKGGLDVLKRYFAPLDKYHPSCQAARKELAAGANFDAVKAKYFIRDSFLEIASQQQQQQRDSTSSSKSAGGGGGSSSSSTGGGGGVSHQCYPHFTCAIDTQDIGRLINDCCRDILQRVHLRMHEIL